MQLRDAQLDGLADASHAWIKIESSLKDGADSWHEQVTSSVQSAGWTGQAAQAAEARLFPMRTTLLAAATEAASIASVLDTAHRVLTAAQNSLRHAISEANSLGMSVSDTGAITIPPIPLGLQYVDPLQESYRLRARAKQIQQEFIKALKAATNADNSVSAALAKMDASVLTSAHPIGDAARVAQLATTLAGFNSKQIPPRDVLFGGPKAVAKWWESLPPEQRQLLINAYPDKIGWLDGLPAADRDQANRARLDKHLAYLEWQQSHGHLSPNDAKDLGRLTTIRDQLQQFQNNGRDMYLLGLNSTTPDGKGRAIVALGNPDHARHVGVYVAGTFDQIDGIAGNIKRINDLYNVTGQIAPGQSVSTIAWLGYGAPQSIIPQAATDGYAQQGGPALNGFVDGLRAAQDPGARAHLTLIGHSYGSTVIGEAAASGPLADFNHPGGLQADDIVVAGSPGMNTDQVGNLNFTSTDKAHHFFAEQSTGDVVPGGALGHGGFAVDFRNGHPVIGGIAPGNPDFGGNIMHVNGGDWSDPGGSHSVYFSDNEGLKNMGRVVVGDYGDISYDYGHAPSK